MKSRPPANDNDLHSARLLWEQRAAKALTDDDLRTVSANLSGFFSILAEWHQQAAANDNGIERPAPDISDAR